MSSFSGVVALADDPGSAVAATLEVDAGMLVLRAGDSELGAWNLDEIRVEQAADGFNLQADGENLLLTTPDVAGFADAVGLNQPKKRKRFGFRSRGRDADPAPMPAAEAPPAAPPAPEPFHDAAPVMVADEAPSDVVATPDLPAFLQDEAHENIAQLPAEESSAVETPSPPSSEPTTLPSIDELRAAAGAESPTMAPEPPAPLPDPAPAISFDATDEPPSDWAPDTAVEPAPSAEAPPPSPAFDPPSEGAVGFDTHPEPGFGFDAPTQPDPGLGLDAPTAPAPEDPFGLGTPAGGTPTADTPAGDTPAGDIPESGFGLGTPKPETGLETPTAPAPEDPFGLGTPAGDTPTADPPAGDIPESGFGLGTPKPETGLETPTAPAPEDPFGLGTPTGDTPTADTPTGDIPESGFGLNEPLPSTEPFSNDPPPEKGLSQPPRSDLGERAAAPASAPAAPALTDSGVDLVNPHDDWQDTAAPLDPAAATAPTPKAGSDVGPGHDPWSTPDVAPPSDPSALDTEPIQATADSPATFRDPVAAAHDGDVAGYAPEDPGPYDAAGRDVPDIAGVAAAAATDRYVTVEPAEQPVDDVPAPEHGADMATPEELTAWVDDVNGAVEEESPDPVIPSRFATLRSRSAENYSDEDVLSMPLTLAMFAAALVLVLGALLSWGIYALSDSFPVERLVSAIAAFAVAGGAYLGWRRERRIAGALMVSGGGVLALAAVYLYAQEADVAIGYLLATTGAVTAIILGIIGVTRFGHGPDPRIHD